MRCCSIHFLFFSVAWSEKNQFSDLILFPRVFASERMQTELRNLAIQLVRHIKYLGKDLDARPDNPTRDTSVLI